MRTTKPHDVSAASLGSVHHSGFRKLVQQPEHQHDVEHRIRAQSDAGGFVRHRLAVDQDPRMIELQTPKGIAFAVPASLLVEKGGRVIAPATSRADVMAMAKTQTGLTVAINIDRRHHAFRG